MSNTSSRPKKLALTPYNVPEGTLASDVFKVANFTFYFENDASITFKKDGTIVFKNIEPDEAAQKFYNKIAEMAHWNEVERRRNDGGVIEPDFATK